MLGERRLFPPHETAHVLAFSGLARDPTAFSCAVRGVFVDRRLACCGCGPLLITPRSGLLLRAHVVRKQPVHLAIAGDFSTFLSAPWGVSRPRCTMSPTRNTVRGRV